MPYFLDCRRASLLAFALLLCIGLLHRYADRCSAAPASGPIGVSERRTDGGSHAGAPAVSGRVFFWNRRLMFSVEEPPVFAEDGEWSRFVSGDFDGDGSDDIAALGRQTNRLWVARSEGEGRFIASAAYSLSPEDTVTHLIAADYDGDGQADLAVVTADGRALLLSSGPGLRLTLRSVIPPFPRFRPSSATAIDLNCDGSPELLLQRRLDAHRFIGLGVHIDDRGEAASVVTRAFPGEVHAMDVDGTGCRSAICPHDGGRTWFRCAERSPPQVWASFPQSDNLSFRLVGDFDGDGLDDVLVERNSAIPGWWLASSNGRTGLEFPVTGPRLRSSGAAATVVGDYNGDGIADLFVSFDGGTPRFQVAYGRPGPPVAGAVIAVGHRETVTSGPDGSFVLRGLQAGTAHLRASKAGVVFRRAERELTLGPRRSKPANFVADNGEPALGAVERLAGTAHGPFVCSGYVPGGWGSGMSKWGRAVQFCPPGYGIFDVRLPDALDEGGTHFIGTCCRLPADDVLIDAESWHEERCPHESIITGMEPSPTCEGCRRKIRCTGINTGRYRLGAVRGGQLWGVGRKGKTTGPRLARAQLPLAIRFGMGRADYARWDPSGCIGVPPGSLWTGTLHGSCGELEFRELQYRGSDGDPPDGTPVTMFPSCGSLDDVFTPTAGCSP
jgi:hypothetical protein